MTEQEVLSPETVAADQAALSELELLRLENTRLKDECTALKEHDAHLRQLAEEEKEADRTHEDMKSRTKAAKENLDQIRESLACAVRGDVQTDFDEEEEGEGELIDFAANPNATADRIAGGDILDFPGLDWSQVERAALSALVSTGKPAKVKPVEILGLEYVLVDVQNRVAILHQVMDAEVFVNRHKVEGAARPDEREPALTAMGEFAGLPVKVGRKVLWLAAEPFLVRIPADAAISATAEVIPGPGSDLVANRIVSQLEGCATVEHMTVIALSKILGVEEDVVRNAAKNSERLVYEIEDINDQREEYISRAQADS